MIRYFISDWFCYVKRRFFLDIASVDGFALIHEPPPGSPLNRGRATTSHERLDSAALPSSCLGDHFEKRVSSRMTEEKEKKANVRRRHTSRRPIRRSGRRAEYPFRRQSGPDEHENGVVWGVTGGLSWDQQPGHQEQQSTRHYAVHVQAPQRQRVHKAGARRLL